MVAMVSRALPQATPPTRRMLANSAASQVNLQVAMHADIDQHRQRGGPEGDNIGNRRAAHTQRRKPGPAECQRTAERHPAQRGHRNDQPRRGRIAGPAQHRGQRIGQPDNRRSAKHDPRITDRAVQRRPPAAEQCKQRFRQQSEQHRIRRRHAQRDQQRVHDQRFGARPVPGAERPGNRGGNPAAHRTRRHHLHHRLHRKHQRQRRQPRHPQLANEPGIRAGHQRLRRDHDDIRQRQPGQRPPDRPFQQPQPPRLPPARRRAGTR